MNRIITVQIWASICGQDHLLKQFTQSADELVYFIHRIYAPNVGISEIKQALLNATCKQGVEWMGGHQIGIQILSIAPLWPYPAPTVKPKFLDDKPWPPRNAKGQFVRQS
jgi:hypothetical protein